VRGCERAALRPLDLSDDRLADVWRVLSTDVHWRACEQEVMGQVARISDLHAQGVRIGRHLCRDGRTGTAAHGPQERSSPGPAPTHARACQPGPAGHTTGDGRPFQRTYG
jgi:hypothetical protein